MKLTLEPKGPKAETQELGGRVKHRGLAQEFAVPVAVSLKGGEGITIKPVGVPMIWASFETLPSWLHQIKTSADSFACF